MSENTFETIEQRVSYGVGRQLGDQLRNNPFKDFDVSAVQAGLADAIANAASQVTDEELNEAFSVVSKKLQEQEQAQAKEKSAEGEAFLAENAKRDEVTVTDSGLQYEVLNTGVKVSIDKDKKLIVTIKKTDLAKDAADARPEVFSPGNALDAKITELDLKTRRVRLSVKAAQIDEEKSLIAKFGEGATKSGATLKGIFEKAIGKKSKKEK